MFGGLHIEMAVMKCIGEWLNGSGWVTALVNAGIASVGTAESFLKVSHVARTRHAHEVTAAAMYALQQTAFEEYKESVQESEQPLDFTVWCNKMKSNQPQFCFWSQVLKLELLVLEIVRTIRDGDFDQYVQSLARIMPWMFALDHVNYARWLSVHVRDMSSLSLTHPSVYQHFTSGAFVVNKSARAFSSIALDHAHEQANASIKGDGGAVGLTENPHALRRWMIGGPELARMVNEYEDQSLLKKKETKKHHDQMPSVKKAFVKVVKDLVDAVEELGNPFREDSGDLLVLDTKDILPKEVVDSVKSIEETGYDQYTTFVKERFVDQKKPITDPIKMNKLPMFSRPPTKVPSKQKVKLTALKEDYALFSRLYIACQSTFREYVATVFIPYVTSQLQSAQRIDIIWDTYKDDSLKSCTRDKRGSGARRHVALSVKIPPNWKSFLLVNENKTELFRLLAEEVIAIHAQGKEVYSTYGNDVLSNTDRTTMNGLQPCNHEEADSRIFLHVHDAALQHHRVLIRSVDTDVFVLAVAQMQRIPDKELWLAFGTGKQFRYLPIHDISRSLGPKRSLALPVFHALTGCDIVSFFGGKSKKSAWDTWNSFPEVTHSFLEIATAPDKLSNKCTQTIERFVVLLYDRGSQLSSVDARQQLFCKRSRSLDRIPPTSAALRQHILRAAYQGGHVWSQVHMALPQLPSPLEWGWKKDELWRPVWTTLPQAQQSCYELIHCSCKKACRGLCKCSRSSLQCTALCSCGGNCFS